MDTKIERVPLLLLPGLWCDHTVWQPQLSAFAAHAPIVAHYPDARDFTDMAYRALDVAPDRFALVGHSMGARVALEIMRVAPERVDRLALLDTGIHAVRPGEAEKRYAQRDLGLTNGVDALIEAWLPPMLLEAHRNVPAIYDPLRDMCRRGGVEMYAAHIEALLARPETDSVLRSIRVPTLVGVGRQDQWSPVSQHAEIVAAIAGSELTIFEDSGHMATVEAPEAVNAALSRWLTQ